MSVSSRWRFIGLVAVTLSLGACAGLDQQAPPASAAMQARVQELARHPCNSATASILEAQGVSAERLQSLVYSGNSGGGMAGRIDSYNAWVGVAGESRNILITHENTCRVIDFYRG